MTEWATAAYGSRRVSAELAIRIVTPAQSRHLNKTYRHMDKPTNVLSFSAGMNLLLRQQPKPLGDLAICAVVVAREARAQHKTLAAHWAHMVVHGTLHLLGYDHVKNVEAQRMERLERRILRDLGFSDPYLVSES
jgi:probable rRNA maturation factor